MGENATGATFLWGKMPQFLYKINIGTYCKAHFIQPSRNLFRSQSSGI